MIPAQAVEAAAEYLPHSEDCEVRPERDCTCRQLRVNLMREALEAAAPRMLADMRPMTMIEIANRDHPERMEAARKKLQDGARESRRIERKHVEASALIDAATRLQQDNPANAVAWLRDQGRTLGISARQEAETMMEARRDNQA